MAEEDSDSHNLLPSSLWNQAKCRRFAIVRGVEGALRRDINKHADGGEAKKARQGGGEVNVFSNEKDKTYTIRRSEVWVRLANQTL